MTFAIQSPFLGLTYLAQYHQQVVQLNVTDCQGDILPALVKMELTFAEQGYQQINLTFSGSCEQQVHRLIKLNYYQSEQSFIKEITYRKAVRFSITEKCNYHCFFCHEEGMEMDVKRESKDLSDIFGVIKQIAELGYDDFTFTGGEPLLNWRALSSCLDYMEEIDYLPEVTIVTNGERINPKVIERLKRYPSKVRFNLSLHSLLDDEYLRIVHREKKPGFGADDLLDKIKQKIALIEQANIPFKLNIVLLKGVNTSKRSLEAILEYAAEHGAISVKFLELLITEGLKDFYSYFYTLNAVRDSLDDDLTLLWQNQKKDVYQYKNSGLEVELQHCPCARGCNTCFLNRGITFTAEMKFYPCFLLPEDNYQLTDTNLAKCIEDGDQYIDGMAKYYQDNSPILIKESYSAKEEKAYYYQVNAEDIKRIVELSQVKQHRIREFSEWYYQQPEQKLNHYHKLSLNTYDNRYLEVQQSITVLDDGQHHTQFKHNGIEVFDLGRYQTSLQDKNCNQVMQLDWKIDYYQNKDMQLSISTNQQTNISILRTDKPFAQLTINTTMIQTPLPEFIKQCIEDPLALTVLERS